MSTCKYAYIYMSRFIPTSIHKSLANKKKTRLCLRNNAQMHENEKSKSKCLDNCKR